MLEKMWHEKPEREDSPERKRQKGDDEASDPTASSSGLNRPQAQPVKEEDGEGDERIPYYREPHEEHGDLAIDEDQAFWSRYCGETKIVANAASLTVPQAEGNEHIDAESLYMQDPLLRTDVWASKLSNRPRKEATATDTRQYAKRFLEAKIQEHQSWKENEVFDLVDARKVAVRK